MALTNPAFSTNPAFQNNGQATAGTVSAENLEQLYQAPSATAAPMSAACSGALNRAAPASTAAIGARRSGVFF